MVSCRCVPTPGVLVVLVVPVQRGPTLLAAVLGAVARVSIGRVDDVIVTLLAARVLVEVVRSVAAAAHRIVT